MREFGILLSIISILIGILLLIAPKVLVKLGEQTNRLYNIDGLIYRNRYAFGLFLMAAAAFMFYTTL
ncbi:MAG: hypothetical protein HN995_02675 [Candidatus Marinimicrobia bacterium]|jgi:hypothetical protein|nr:hypothetical protein [Candidatus Neomarinimicrobiota bacterium]MBT3576470.1 hypothetical protein [Candidatus Neomarinimicrobiota bacterium]MBT3949571.1 hypothetical protein [Candidatus Neomarinimicrobiota bacterium]MBT4251909.1 hypothetical protein [Candidatus Neomarinimicrobiota bacterium]MBT4481709.1 hypothetical protein [Candidatus Neomarinimicrobiota bacterium]